MSKLSILSAFATLLLPIAISCSHQMTEDAVLASNDALESEDAVETVALNDEDSAAPAEVASAPEETNTAAVSSETNAATPETPVSESVLNSVSQDLGPTPSNEGAAASKNATPAPAKKHFKKRAEAASPEVATLAQAQEEKAPAVAPASSAADDFDEAERPQLASAELQPMGVLRNHVIALIIGISVLSVWVFVAWRRKRRENGLPNNY